MSRNKKRLALIGSGIAITALAVGGVAFAAFNQTAQANADGGAGTETFAPLAVSGQWMGRAALNGTYPADAKLLLPGESGDVQLTLENPDENTVQGEVVSITPAALSNDCYGNIKVAKYTPGTNLVLRHGSGQVKVILKNAVTLDAGASEVCQGLQFTPSYTVQFQATRADLANPGVLNP